MLYIILKLILRPDIAYKVKKGLVTKHSGKNSDRYIDDIEAICRIHKTSRGMLFGKWVGDRYKISVFGKLKSAKIPLSNCINS